MPEVQSYKNHTRFEPGFHFVLIPVLLINFLLTLFVLIRRWPYHSLMHGWLVVMALALLLLAGVARSSAIRVQDRVIRLEEQLRYQRLLTPELLTSAQSFSLRQIVALRFASDADLPGLVQRASAEKMEPKAIKQAIQVWRPDTLRV